jgi:hypothetical protein
MKPQWEENAKDHFIAELEALGRGDWTVSATDVVVDKLSKRNFDYELRRENEFIALELFRLVEGEQEVARSKVWSKIANRIAAELRKKGVKGYTIQSPNFFDVPQLKIPGFVSKTATLLETAIKQNPNADLIPIDGYEIKWIEGFPDVSLFSTGPGGFVNPAATARDAIIEKLPKKNSQLEIANHERIILIVNWALLVSRSDMIEACSLVDFSQFGNIDKVYFELPNKGGIHLVYDRQIYAAFQRNGQPPQVIEPLFVLWLANLLYRKDPQAFRLVRQITEREKSLLWLPTLSREELVSYGDDFLQEQNWEQLDWIIDNLKNDPDPSIENAPDDPEGKFNIHLQTKNGESSRIISTVRARLCWLLMRMAVKPCLDQYERIFDIVEEYARGENFYVRLHATVPLIELARRRLAKVDGNTRFMSNELAERIKKLALWMVDENSAYPAVLEWVAHVMVCIGDVDNDTALDITNKFLTIDNSESAADISWMVIYFAFFRENQFKELPAFKSDEIRSLLKDRLAVGSDHFRATAVKHLEGCLGRGEIAFEAATPYLERLFDGKVSHTANYHLFEILAKQVNPHSEIVGHLIEKAVAGELKSIDAGGREIWHSQRFSQALNTLERSGAEHKERVAQIRKSMEPYKEKRRIYDIPDL